MGKIKRWGKQIVNSRGNMKFLDENVDKYLPIIRKFVKEKIVFIVPKQACFGWVESPLCDWFSNHHKELGFEVIEIERSEKYYRLKEELGFYGYPDFLALQNNKWFRVEVEVFSSDYHHGIGYAEIMLCYDKTKDIEDKEVKIINFRELKGYKEIIALFEIADFLYLYDERFKKDQENWMMKKLDQIMVRRFSKSQAEINSVAEAMNE